MGCTRASCNYSLLILFSLIVMVYVLAMIAALLTWSVEMPLALSKLSHADCYVLRAEASATSVEHGGLPQVWVDVDVLLIADGGAKSTTVAGHAAEFPPQAHHDEEDFAAELEEARLTAAQWASAHSVGSDNPVRCYYNSTDIVDGRLTVPEPLSIALSLPVGADSVIAAWLLALLSWWTALRHFVPLCAGRDPSGESQDYIINKWAIFFLVVAPGIYWLPYIFVLPTTTAIRLALGVPLVGYLVVGYVLWWKTGAPRSLSTCALPIACFHHIGGCHRRCRRGGPDPAYGVDLSGRTHPLPLSVHRRSTPWIRRRAAAFAVKAGLDVWQPDGKVAAGEETCCVCLEKRRRLVLSCGHALCADCGHERRGIDRCPLCRADIEWRCDVADISRDTMEDALAAAARRTPFSPLGAAIGGVAKEEPGATVVHVPLPAEDVEQLPTRDSPRGAHPLAGSGASGATGAAGSTGATGSMASTGSWRLSRTLGDASSGSYAGGSRG